MNIGVIGGGVGGLAVSIALANVGFKVTIFERLGCKVNSGAGIQISSNGVKVLRYLGIEKQIEKVSCQSENIKIKNGRTGRQIAKIPLGRQAEKRYGSKFFLMHRSDLIDQLTKRALDCGVHIEYQSEASVSYFTDNNAIVSVNGKERVFSVVIAADGVKSEARKQFFDKSRAIFLKQCAYRTLVRSENLPKEFQDSSVNLHLGPSKHVVSYPIRNGTLINFVFCFEHSQWQEDGWSIPATERELIEEFEDFPLAQILKNKTESLNKWGLFGYESVNDWSKGRLTLLGDSCHPFLPYLAQGATQALEDAHALSMILANKSSVSLSERLGAYGKIRCERVRRIAEASARNAFLFHLKNPLFRLCASFGLGAASNMFPSLLLSRFDWLYGYEFTDEN